MLNVGRDGRQLSPGQAYGAVRILAFDFTQTAAIQSQDVINIGIVPAGCTVLQAYCTAAGGTLSCNYTIKVSDTTSVFVAHAITNAYPIAGVTTALYTTTAESLMTVRFSTVSDGGAAGEVIRGYILYAR